MWRRRKKRKVEIRVKQRAEFVIVDDEISSMPFTVVSETVSFPI